MKTPSMRRRGRSLRDAAPMRHMALLFATFLAAGSVSAQTPPAEPDMTLASVVESALRDNPDLTSLLAKWEAMLERRAQAGALPDPMLKYSGMDTASGGKWPNTNEKRLMVEQEFPWFGKRGLREGIAVKDAEAMQLELETMAQDVVLMAKETYYDLYAVQRVIGVTRTDGEVLQSMSKIADAQYATGQRSQQDALKAKSEITMLKQRLLALEAQKNALKAKLNRLMNRRADAPLGTAVTGPPLPAPVSAERLFDLAATNRPEVHAAQVQTERYGLERQLMSKDSAPDYKLGLEYRNFSDSDDMVMFTVSVDLPVWQSKYRAGVREADRMMAASQAAREAAVRQSALDVQDAQFKLMTARQSLDLYRAELIPQAEARFKASEAGYQTGKVDFLDLLESQRFLINAHVMAAMAEGTVGMQSARLDRAVGRDLTAGAPAAGTTGAREGAEHAK